MTGVQTCALPISYSRQNLLQTMRSLHTGGLEIILSSHNMEDITELAHDMTLLDHGRSLGTGTASDVFSQADLIQQANLIAPPGVKFAAALRSKGWGLPENYVTFRDIDQFLAMEVR